MSDPTPEPKHLDATKPGVVPVSHTSKPALVAPQQLARDPMMRGSELAESDIPIQEHKKSDLKPAMTKAEIESERPAEEKSKDDAELPKEVIEAKQPVIDQQSEKIQSLIDKKTYNLPIKSTSTKIFLKIAIATVVVVVLAVMGFVIFAMNT